MAIKLTPELEMETHENTLDISSGLKPHCATPTNRASTQPVLDTEKHEKRLENSGTLEPS